MLSVACVTAPSEPVGVACPDLVEYSRETQQKILMERLALPAASILNDILRDYLQLRDQVRECQKSGN